ncbi:hypothetical protein ACJX0J_025361, partial [Zea mays]
PHGTPNDGQRATVVITSIQFRVYVLVILPRKHFADVAIKLKKRKKPFVYL